MGGAPRAKVASDMTFTLKSVAPMHYNVYVNGVPDSCFVKSIRYGGQEVPEDGIDITAGGEMEVTLSATAGEVDSAAPGDGEEPGPELAFAAAEGVEAAHDRYPHL